MNLDVYLFRLINNRTRKNKWLDRLGIFIADYLIFALVFFLFLFSLLQRKLNLFIIPFSGGVFSRFIGNEIVYLLYKRKRPPEILDIQPLIKIPSHPSFPSGHLSFILGISFNLFYYNFHLAFIFLVIAFFIFFFRVFVGVHWPSDIIGSLLISFLSFCLIKYLFLL